MSGTVIAAGARTPIGKLSGALGGFSAAELGGFAIAAALERAGVEPESVDYVLMGQVLQAGAGQITARQAASKAGVPMTVPATTINKVCLSGLNTIYLADLLINAGEAEIVVAGGHGVDDTGALPAPGCKRRLPARGRDARGLDDVRRALLRVRRLCDGPRHRALQRRRRRLPRASGRVQRALPRACRGRDQRRSFRGGDRPGERPAAEGRPVDRRDRRGSPSRDDGGVPRQAATRLRQGGDHHRGQCLPDLRRRGCGRRALQGQGRRARDRSPRRAGQLRPGGRTRAPRCSTSRRTRPRWPWRRRGSRSRTSTSSRSTRRSPRSVSPRPTISASGPTWSTSTEGRSRSGIPSACREPVSRSTALLELKRRGGGTAAVSLCGGGGQGDAAVLRTI